MTTELNIKITAETAEEAMLELAALSFRAAQELGVAPHAPDEVLAAVIAGEPIREVVVEKANGAGPPPAKEPKPSKTKKAAPAPEPEAAPEAKVDREAVINGLTRLYGGGSSEVREKIRAWRDEHGAERLLLLRDEALPAAAAFLAELEADAAP